MGKMANIAKKTLGGGGVTGGLEIVDKKELMKKYPKGVAVTGFDVRNFEGQTYYKFAFYEEPESCFTGSSIFEDLVENWLDAYDGNIEEANRDLREEPVIIRFEERTSQKTKHRYLKPVYAGTLKLKPQADSHGSEPPPFDPDDIPI